MVDCKVCKHRFRLDHLKDRSQCPDCGSKDSFTEPRNFNLMMRDVRSARWKTRRRWRTCAPKPLRASSSISRTSIRPRASGRPSASRRSASRSATRSRRATSRSALREFEQAELEYFVPDDGNDMDAFQQWVERRKAWYSNYGIKADRLRFYELTRAGAPALRESRHRRRVSLSVGMGRARIDRASRHLRPRRAHEALGQGPALLRRGEQDALHAAAHRELGRHGPDDAHVAGRRLRTRDAASIPNGKETERDRAAFPSVRSRRCRSPSSRSRATSPSWCERARGIESGAASERTARSTTKETSASSIGAKTKSARRSA